MVTALAGVNAWNVNVSRSNARVHTQITGQQAKDFMQDVKTAAGAKWDHWFQKARLWDLLLTYDINDRARGRRLQQAARIEWTIGNLFLRSSY